MSADLPEIPSDEAIKARLDAALSRAKKISDSAGKDPDLSDQVASRMERIEAKIESAGLSAFPEVPELPSVRNRVNQDINQEKAEVFMSLGVGLSVAYSLVGATILGWGVGYLVQLRTGSELAVGIGVVCGATVGLASGIFTIVIAQRKQDAADARLVRERQKKRVEQELKNDD